MRTVARTAVVAGTAVAVGGAVHGHQEKKAMEAQQAQAAAAAPPPEAAPAEAEGAPVPGSPEAIAQLKELAGLHEQGILTDQEFADQKAKLLA
ncbi:MAG: SHOCT domain-containing protein [Acidimicrobiales bacterium]